MDYSIIVREVADTLENITWGLNKSYSNKINSLTIFIASIMLTITGAYSSSYILKLIIIIFSLSILISLSNIGILKNALKTYLYVNTFAFFLGLPTLFIYRSSDVLISILETMLTVTAASSPMIVLFILIGLRNIVKALGYFSKHLETIVSIFIALIPKLSRIVSDIIIARMSRNIGGNNIRSTWSILSISIADAIVHTNALSQNLTLAIMSRDIGSNENSKTCIGFKPLDIILLLATSYVMVLGLVVLK